MSQDAIEYLDTHQVAQLFCVKPQSINARICRTGSLWGVKPLKAPNRRNLFLSAEIHALITERRMSDDSAKAE
ncbi:DNA-binding protein [Paraburkholderia sp. RP-4-7]|uniref:DNA-binding protein n=1 Tax=Paraburkholderia polaris TaxID=2728848 RepID=A0A848IG21_9BURK|nr:DNA-binding protein [Paraburkholderia polaris]NML99645.1 DNA-binding protein [Paraburkholderia polaris]